MSNELQMNAKIEILLTFGTIITSQARIHCSFIVLYCMFHGSILFILIIFAFPISVSNIYIVVAGQLNHRI